MRKFLKGKHHLSDAVDFQTSTALYEVKSCNLFNGCCNGNHKRKFSEQPHKCIETFQSGRFWVRNKNHKLLKEEADECGKKAKYVFVVAVKGQIIWKVIDWAKVQLRKDKDYTYILLHTVFGGDNE